MNPDITDKQVLELELKANQVRQHIITMLVAAGSGHSGGPLGMADIFTTLYFYVLNHNPKEPDWLDRDRLILSNGHICPVRYATMALAGYFPLDELMTLRKINSRLQGHPHRTALPGLETTSGPLGEGLGQAVGMALAARMDNKKHFVYCLTSDGEHQEGSTWEAAMIAGKYKLDHLIEIIDYNNIQIDGNVSDIMPLEPFKEKYEAFNWEVIEIAGNDIKEIVRAISEAKGIHDKPILILARTIPGKGVSFMENDYRWHGNPPDVGDVPGSPPKGQQGQAALDELKKEEQRLQEALTHA